MLALAAAGCVRAIQPEDDSDSAIKARVVSAISGRKDLDIRYVSIDVDRGAVTLSGIIPSLDQSRAIGKIASRTPGVDRVMNNLLVPE